jgi:hypothetical protein
MSTVLWANTLRNGEVESNEYDLYALYKHSQKLDKLTKKLGTISFISTHDFTDMQFNISDDELPEGVESTDEIMAQNGVWVPGSEATRMLDELISHISSQKIKFGLFKDDVEEVLDELNKSLEVAKKARSANGMFNFAIVM